MKNTRQLDGQQDLLHMLGEQTCETCAQIEKSLVSCGTHRKGPMYEWHDCSVCDGSYYGVPFDNDKGSAIFYGPVSVRYCSATCRPAALALFDRLRDEYKASKEAGR